MLASAARPPLFSSPLDASVALRRSRCRLPHPLSSFSAHLRRPTRRAAVPLVLAVECSGDGYQRVPMDTPGAYRLVDKSTGESVVVWGGSEDSDDTPIPSEDALSWSSGANKTQRLARSIVPSTGNFGRLKTQKMNALIRKNSHLRKVNTGRSSQVADDTLVSDVDSTVSHEVSKEGSSSAFLQYAEMDGDVDHGTSCEPDPLHVNSDNHEIDPCRDVASSRGNPPLQRWGVVSDTTIGLLKRHRKDIADSGFFSNKSFKDIGCNDDLITALRSLMFTRPSHIQAMAYRPILEGKTCIIADQSGSGKTLAYLAPIIQSLRQEEVLGICKSSPRNPRVIVLAPTAELASQVLRNCRSISKFGVPFRSTVATGGFRQKTQLESLEQEVDVLIATPGRLVYLLQEGFLQLTKIRSVVLDEVDILFREEGFEQVLQQLINSAPVSAQYLFVTATLPVDIYNKVIQIFPDSNLIMGPGVHRTSSRLEEILVDCSGEEGQEKNPDTAFSNKRSALLQIAEASPVRKTIVFCNKIETCRKVENIMKRFDRRGSSIKVLAFHAALAKDVRHANMEEFLKSESADSMFLVCTDRASRGIDFPSVDHVVLFDFPRDPSEYVRRVGRTARGANGKGKAYILVVGKQVSLARRIMERNRKGHPLHEVPCA